MGPFDLDEAEAEYEHRLAIAEAERLYQEAATYADTVLVSVRERYDAALAAAGAAYVVTIIAVNDTYRQATGKEPPF